MSNEYDINVEVLRPQLRLALVNSATECVPVGVINSLTEVLIASALDDLQEYDPEAFIPTSLQEYFDEQIQERIEEVEKYKKAIKDLKEEFGIGYVPVANRTDKKPRKR